MTENFGSGTDELKQLVEQWHDLAYQRGYDTWTMEYCANELAARLTRRDAPQEQKDQGARVEPSVPCVEPAGSTAEQSLGAVTAAERTEKTRAKCSLCGAPIPLIGEKHAILGRSQERPPFYLEVDDEWP